MRSYQIYIRVVVSEVGYLGDVAFEMLRTRLAKSEEFLLIEIDKINIFHIAKQIFI